MTMTTAQRYAMTSLNEIGCRNVVFNTDGSIHVKCKHKTYSLDLRDVEDFCDLAVLGGDLSDFELEEK